MRQARPMMSPPQTNSPIPLPTSVSLERAAEFEKYSKNEFSDSEESEHDEAVIPSRTLRSNAPARNARNPPQTEFEIAALSEPVQQLDEKERARARLMRQVSTGKTEVGAGYNPGNFFDDISSPKHNSENSNRNQKKKKTNYQSNKNSL